MSLPQRKKPEENFYKKQLDNLQKERSERERDLVILNEVATEISSKLEVKELLPKIVDNAIDIVGTDAGIIAMFDRQRQKYEFSYVKNLPENLTKVSSPEKGISVQVLTERQPILIEDYSKEPKAIPEFIEAGTRGTLIVPIMAKDQVYGALGVINFKPYKFSKRHVRLLQSVANQAAIAIENARLYSQLKEAFERESFIAERLSRSLLPPDLPQIPNTELGIYYLSATPAAYVGGDFYDYLKLEDKVIFIVGDISGKGVEVASLTAMAKHVIRTLTYLGYEPEKLLTVANQIIYKEIAENFFVALSYYVYDWKTGEIVFVNAGQRHAYYCSRITACNFIETWQPALGIVKDHKYQAGSLKLEPDDVLSIYTDGLVEVRSNSTFFEELLPELINKYARFPAQFFTNKVIQELQFFNPQKELPDDVVLLAIKRVR